MGMGNMLRTLRMVHRPRPDAMPGGGLDAPPGMAFFAPSSGGIDVGDAEGTLRASRPSALVTDEHAGRKAEGLSTRGGRGGRGEGRRWRVNAGP